MSAVRARCLHCASVIEAASPPRLGEAVDAHREVCVHAPASFVLLGARVRPGA